MGLDIFGWIECKQVAYEAPSPKRKRINQRHPQTKATWEAAINLDHLYRGRDYDAFACLFGVKNTINFRPVAAGRGIPLDASAQVRADVARLGSGYQSPSWIAWNEMKRINWEEETETASRIHVFRKSTDGTLVPLGDLHMLGQEREYWLQDFQKRVGSPEHYIHSSWEQEWDAGEVVYRTKKTRREEQKGAWNSIFQVMEALAFQYEDEGVRLVVWFVF